MERGGSDECTVNLKFISYYCHELSAQTLPFLPFIMAYAGRLYSNGLQVHERVKILLLEVCERGLKGLPGLVI